MCIAPVQACRLGIPAVHPHALTPAGTLPDAIVPCTDAIYKTLCGEIGARGYSMPYSAVTASATRLAGDSRTTDGWPITTLIRWVVPEANTGSRCE